MEVTLGEVLYSMFAIFTVVGWNLSRVLRKRGK